MRNNLNSTINALWIFPKLCIKHYTQERDVEVSKTHSHIKKVTYIALPFFIFRRGELRAWERCEVILHRREPSRERWRESCRFCSRISTPRDAERWFTEACRRLREMRRDNRRFRRGERDRRGERLVDFIEERSEINDRSRRRRGGIDHGGVEEGSITYMQIHHGDIEGDQFR